MLRSKHEQQPEGGTQLENAGCRNLSWWNIDFLNNQN